MAHLHIRVADWHAQNGLLLEAIYHASAAADEERVERFIEQIYMELVSRAEQSWLRSWTNKLSKEQVYCRPWLCIYEAYSHAWFGELDEAERLLEQAEKQIRSEPTIPEAQSMQGHLYYVKSRVTAMRGDLPRAIELCLQAREYIPDSNLALQFDSLRRITVPLLRPAILFVCVMTMISSFQVFDIFQVMTRGGPQNQTTPLLVSIWENAFRYQNMGWAAAISMVLFIIILVIMVIQFRLLRTDWEY